MQFQLKFLNGSNLMRIVKFIIFLASIFIIIFLISLVLPSKVTVSKSVEINATEEKVKDQIVNFEKWKNWYPAFENKEISVTKSLPQPHILSSVTLKNIKGKAIILNLIDSAKSTILIEVHSTSSTEVNYQFILTPKQNEQTQLTWNVNTTLGWLPWKKMEGILFDKLSGTEYESALDNLRKAAEDN